jgi:ATP-dependent RNA helicase DHX8/PRP22
MVLKNLPICSEHNGIITVIRDNPVTVLIGETASGKSTQLSKILLEYEFFSKGIIGITQPRRIAAVSTACRVAKELKVHCGLDVGYKVRFEDRTSIKTKIKFLTDGALLRETLENSFLLDYSILILDEAHERNLNMDILFGVLKNLNICRNKIKNKSILTPFRLIITSATMDGECFSLYYDCCPVICIKGRIHPVEVLHLDSMLSYNFDESINCVVDIHCYLPKGDILLFLTGQQEIEKATRQIQTKIKSLPSGSIPDLLVLPLYAALHPEQQARVFLPTFCRRCIVATNIAETSITLEGIVYVVDPGYVKQKEFKTATAMDSLYVVKISRVQATQRKGRAGRTVPGKCFRLYTKEIFEHTLPAFTKPEIYRVSLIGCVLYLKSLFLTIDIFYFDFLEKPNINQLEDALHQLFLLGALDLYGNVTFIGEKMSRIPLDTVLARGLITALDLGCESELLSVAAMLTTESFFCQRIFELFNIQFFRIQR